MKHEANRVLTTQTLGVLAGAYRGKKAEARTLLTHLLINDGETSKVGCRQPKDRLVDEYGMTDEEIVARPTCTTCAKKWDKIHGAL